jgi:hypothetical protein
MLSPKRLLAFCLSLGLLWWEAQPSYSADGQINNGGVYCLRSNGGTKIFAGKIRKTGKLSFGVSIWNAHGNNITIFGVALRKGQGWEYLGDMNEPRVEDRCKLTILLDRGAVRISADPSATCESMGGYGTEIGEVLFPRSAYEGPVTSELSDAEVFVNNAGKCWRK